MRKLTLLKQSYCIFPQSTCEGKRKVEKNKCGINRIYLLSTVTGADEREKLIKKILRESHLFTFLRNKEKVRENLIE